MHLVTRAHATPEWQRLDENILSVMGFAFAYKRILGRRCGPYRLGHQGATLGLQRLQLRQLRTALSLQLFCFPGSSLCLRLLASFHLIVSQSALPLSLCSRVLDLLQPWYSEMSVDFFTGY